MSLTGCRPLFGPALALALFGCATTPQPSAEMSASATSAASSASDFRELTADEKRVIAEAVSVAIRDPASARFRWARFRRSAASAPSANYCAMVNAKSQHPAYNGWQAYVVSVEVTNGHITSAVIGAIAGGKDIPVVSKICKRYGLDPNDAV
jgi:hypothetical protein